MNRREFLQAGAAGLALSSLGGAAREFAAREPKRVGLIGTGWYGKCDLFRLIQVAPVEVVSLCDVDKKMLAEAAEHGRRAAGLEEDAADLRRLPRDAQGEGPRHRPDRHARPLARPADDRRRRGRGRRLRPEADQRRRGRGPGDARRRAQAQAGRAGRHPAPEHAAPDRGPRPDRPARASSARSAWSRSTATTTCGPASNPPDTAPPEYLDYEMWTGPAPMRPYNPLVHPRGWRAFMEYGNGIVGDMCIHMLDMVRWMLDLGWPKRIASTGGILVRQGEQGEHHRHADRHVRLRRPRRRLAAPHLGRRRPTRSTPGARRSTATRGRSRRASMSYDFIPLGEGKPIHKDVAYELEQYPEDKTEKDLEQHVAPAIRGHMQDFLAGDRHARQAGGRHRGRAHLDRELHPGQPGAEARPDARPGTPRRAQVVGDDEANRLLRRPYREPWVHPAQPRAASKSSPRSGLRGLASSARWSSGPIPARPRASRP